MENNPLNYVSFPRKVSVKQEIVDTDTGEILLHLESSILFLNLKFFGLLRLFEEKIHNLKGYFP